MEEPSKFIFKDHPLNYIKGLSIESDNWRWDFEDFWDRGDNLLYPPYPKIGSGRRYSEFSCPRGPLTIFVPLYMLGLEPKTCGDRTMRGLFGRYSPVSLNYIIISISYLI